MLMNLGAAPLAARRFGASVCMTVAAAMALVAAPPAARRSKLPAAPMEWKSAARWRRTARSVRGTIAIDPGEVRFLSGSNSLAWRFVEIRTFYADPHRLVIDSYSPRPRHLPGTRSFRFDLAMPLPPPIAARLAEEVGKPSRNADPATQGAAFAVLGARHATRWGGSNGVLRFGDRGIDYVTAAPRDSRRWRWADIQTLAHPDPYHFRVAGFQEIYDFDLKQPMSRELFDSLWDRVYGRNLQVFTNQRGANSDGTETKN